MHSFGQKTFEKPSESNPTGLTGARASGKTVLEQSRFSFGIKQKCHQVSCLRKVPALPAFWVVNAGPPETRACLVCFIPERFFPEPHHEDFGVNAEGAVREVVRVTGHAGRLGKPG
jgi:hypothetical protein